MKIAIKRAIKAAMKNTWITPLGKSLSVVLMVLLMSGFYNTTFTVTGVPSLLVVEGIPSTTIGVMKLKLGVDPLADPEMIVSTDSRRALLLGVLSAYATGSEITVKGSQLGHCTGGLCRRTIHELVL